MKFFESVDPFTPKPRRFEFRALLPPYTFGTQDHIFGLIPYYSNHYYDRRWFQLTIGKLHDFLRQIDHVYYWIAYRTTQTYHIVYTGLKPNYYDIDVIMFHACFALLGRFVEEELGIPDPECPDCAYKGYRLHSESGTDQIAIDLWLWFKNELPIIEKTYWEDSEKYQKPDFLEKIKDDKLAELIKIRSSLWT